MNIQEDDYKTLCSLCKSANKLWSFVTRCECYVCENCLKSEVYLEDISHCSVCKSVLGQRFNPHKGSQNTQYGTGSSQICHKNSSDPIPYDMYEDRFVNDNNQLAKIKVEQAQAYMKLIEKYERYVEYLQKLKPTDLLKVDSLQSLQKQDSPN